MTNQDKNKFKKVYDELLYRTLDSQNSEHNRAVLDLLKQLVTLSGGDPEMLRDDGYTAL